ncbi:MAG: Rrf2 family transcriptional regulator [Lachnospiraceae bacterium]|nr:Rrf2 family transcriptional regulator [Lachnospiraceae bacterium]
MKYSTRLSDAVHILVFIHQSDSDTITSADIAKSIQAEVHFLNLCGMLVGSLIQSQHFHIQKRIKTITIPSARVYITPNLYSEGNFSSDSRFKGAMEAFC